MVTRASKSVALPAIMDLDALDSIRDGLIDAVEEGAVVVHADGVERVSTNALFMLISAAETSRRNHFDFTIERPSVPLKTAITRLGLDARFATIVRG